MEVRGRQIVVTGAASGMGEATARLLTERGAHVIALDRAPIAIPGVLPIALDLADATSINDTVARIRESVDGPIEALCNIAGLHGSASPRTVIAVNMVGTRVFTEALLPQLAADASVVNVASIGARQWRSNVAVAGSLADLTDLAAIDEWLVRNPIEPELAYKISKEALLIWTMRLARDRAHGGVRFNVVSPGFTDTPMIREALANGVGRVGALAERGTRMAAPVELARIFAFLCSDDSRVLNGAEIAADSALAAIMNGDEFGY